MTDQSDSLHRTTRQEITDLLSERELSFDELRDELALSVRRMEDHLRHVERSLRRGAETLRVVPARCAGCGFEFTRRVPKHFHTPSRCPRCRGERVQAARFRVAAR